MALSIGVALVERLLADPSASIEPRATALDARPAHEPGDASATDRRARLSHGSCQPRTAVGVQAARVDSADLLGDRRIVELALAGSTRFSDVGARTCHAKMLAHHRNEPRLTLGGLTGCLDSAQPTLRDRR